MKPRKRSTNHLRLPVMVALALAAVSGCSTTELRAADVYEEDLACSSFAGDPADLIEVSVAVLGNAE